MIQAISTKWHKVASLKEFEDLEDGGVLTVAVEGQAIALCPFDGAIYAIHNLCSHGAAFLSDGYLDGCLLECPLHQGLIDIRDGSAQSAPLTEGVASFAVKVEGDAVFVGMPD